MPLIPWRPWNGLYLGYRHTQEDGKRDDDTPPPPREARKAGSLFGSVYPLFVLAGDLVLLFWEGEASLLGVNEDVSMARSFSSFPHFISCASAIW